MKKNIIKIPAFYLENNEEIKINFNIYFWFFPFGFIVPATEFPTFQDKRIEFLQIKFLSSLPCFYTYPD